VSVIRSSLTAWSGFALGPLAWAVSTQANYSWATLRCNEGIRFTSLIALVLALCAVGGAALSWRALRQVDASPAEAPRKPRTERFVASLGIGFGLLFALGILFQLAATFIFSGC